nr:MAG TPA: hypothetical protein [Caudoviricetes sp.]
MTRTSGKGFLIFLNTKPTVWGVLGESILALYLNHSLETAKVYTSGYINLPVRLLKRQSLRSFGLLFLKGGLLIPMSVT